MTAAEPTAITTSDDYQQHVEAHLSRQGQSSPAAPPRLPRRPTESLDSRIWRAAYYIADVGGSNPVGIANALNDLSRELLHATSTPAVQAHPGLRAIAGHLAFLYGQGPGPHDDDLRAVRTHAKQLGLLT